MKSATTNSSNSNFHKAKSAKNDEFYTQLSDIEKEMKHYKKHFKNKVVFLNCDDPQESNFWRFFSANFEHLGLKRLIATHYVKESEPCLNDITSYKLEIIRDVNGDGKINNLDTVKTTLKGNGDFRSDECIEILKEANIVVTNPPFSLFREYISTLVEHKKKFIVVGHQGAVIYKDVFKLIKENKVWLGYGFAGNVGFFINKHYKDYATSSQHKEGMIRVSGVVWFTNIDTKKRHEDIILYKEYKKNKTDYPTYDNYNAINVDKVKDIPIDYDGVMGVPVTFMNKHNPEQFEILGITSGRHEFDKQAHPTKRYKNAIQINTNGGESSGSKANTGGCLISKKKPTNTYYIADNADGYMKMVYTRILIKRK